MFLHKMSPRFIALELINRSSCKVGVAAVLSDRVGIFATGWNHPGNNGLGEHAEQFAIKRANKKRLFGATLTVAGRWKKSGNFVYAKPCAEMCLRLAKKYGIQHIEYTTKDEEWEELDLRYVKI